MVDMVVVVVDRVFWCFLCGCVCCGSLLFCFVGCVVRFEGICW